MDALPAFSLLRPTTLDEALKARAAHPDSRALGGGTDLTVNIRRGIVAPSVLIEMNNVAELRAIQADANGIEVGASVTLAELSEHPDVRKHYPVVAQAAHEIAGPTHRIMGTVGGNLCLDTRCIYYNQSEWWRDANDHCLKTTGTMCHVAPKSRGVCFATFAAIWRRLFSRSMPRSISPDRTGRRTVPLNYDLYRLCAPGHSRHGDCKATANSFSRCVRARSSRRCAQRTCRGCVRPMTRSASAGRSNIRSRAWRSR